MRLGRPLTIEQPCGATETLTTNSFSLSFKMVIDLVLPSAIVSSNYLANFDRITDANTDFRCCRLGFLN